MKLLASLKNTLLFFILFFPFKASTQPGNYWYIAFYLFDKGEMLSSDNRNFEASIKKCDTVYTDKLICNVYSPKKEYNNTAFSFGSYGNERNTAFHLKIIRKKDKATMNIFLRDEMLAFARYYLISFQQGDFYIPLINNHDSTDKFIPLQEKTSPAYETNKNTIFKEMLKRADAHYKQEEYEKAIYIYNYILENVKKDETVADQLKKAYPELHKQRNEQGYLSQIDYADKVFKEKDYKKAKTVYIASRDLSKTRDAYILKKLAEIEKIEKAKDKK